MMQSILMKKKMGHDFFVIYDKILYQVIKKLIKRMATEEDANAIRQQLEALEKESQELDDKASLIDKGSETSNVKKKIVSNEHLIDFNSENNDWNQKQNGYCVGLMFLLILTGVGVILNVTAWSMTKQNEQTIDSFFAAFKNLSHFNFKCYNTSDGANPCNYDPGVKKLYNYQTASFFIDETPTKLFSCLEIDGQIVITPNFTDPNRISFSDANHLFSLNSLIFPNTVTTANDQITSSTPWLQSNIRTLPGTFVKMNNANLNVVPGNIYAIQPPLQSYTYSVFHSADYCNNTNSFTWSDTLVGNFPVFIYFNPTVSQLNGTVPTFTICTCVQSINNAYVSKCIPGNSFTKTT